MFRVLCTVSLHTSYTVLPAGLYTLEPTAQFRSQEQEATMSVQDSSVSSDSVTLGAPHRVESVYWDKQLLATEVGIHTASNS